MTVRALPGAVRRFWRIAWHANLTGLASMIAYNMLLAVIPIALLGLFVAGQVLSSHAVAQSVASDLDQVFPGTADQTLHALLREVRDSTTSTGVLALVASFWLGSSFWGALDTAFARIFGGPARGWWRQKGFAVAMLVVVLLFMIATVAVPTAQSILRAGANELPFDLAHVGVLVYVASLAVSLAILFVCLVVIYARVPHRRMPWSAIWPGALGATVAIAIVDYAFPAYLSSISTIARFGTTIVFILILLAWFYALAVIILGGAIVNAMRLGVGLRSEGC
ncbi:MAG: YihY/virulence factor BrkB family protein [Solirubrobacteraceae bacterium]